jgi:hypothetical protein
MSREAMVTSSLKSISALYQSESESSRETVPLVLEI